MTFPRLSRLDLGIFLAIAVAFFASRLVNLDLVPIFTDEAIYLRWSQIGSYDANWRFIPLTDGKPPLFHWLVMGTIRIFSDPLVAGRLVSVAAGAANLVLIWLIAVALFGDKVTAHLSALLYLISPFMLVYDRLALVDGLLTTTSLASFFFAVLLIKTLRLDVGLLLGAAIGLGLLTKASGLLFLLLTPITYLLSEQIKKPFSRPHFHWLLLLGLSALISQGFFGVLRLSPFFYRIGQKNLEFIIPLSRFLQEPFAMTWGNAKSLFTWQLGYLTLPVFFLIVYALFVGRDRFQKLTLALYYFIPFVLIASFNKVIFPRFLLIFAPFLLLLAAWGLDSLLSKTKSLKVRYLLVIALLVPSVLTSIAWIYRPQIAAIPQADKDQYIQGIPSGHGVNQIIEIVDQASANGPVVLGTDGTFGLTPNAFELYLRDNAKVEVKGYFPVDTVPQELIDEARDKQVFFVYFNVQDVPVQDNLELVAEFPKVSPDKTTYLRLYLVKPA